MTHLGDLACALVDARLDSGAHDQALAHLAGCTQCRREVVELRRAKTLLAVARAPVEPGPELLARLLQICDDRSPAAENEMLVSGLRSTPRRRRSTRLLGRVAPSWPLAQVAGGVHGARRRPVSLRTGGPAGRRVAVRSVAAAGFAASVVVGLGGGVSGSVAPAAAGAPTATGSPATDTSRAILTMAPIDASVGKPNGRVAVSVVYRRP